MCVFKRFAFLLFVLIPFLLSAFIHGNMPGGEPTKQWEEEGFSRDYFIMFNSLLDDQLKLPSEIENNNPQGDTCLESSSFDLTAGSKDEESTHIPDDAEIIEAYIIWTGAVDPGKLEDPTDNTVNLLFEGAHEGAATDPADVELEVSVGEEGFTLDTVLPHPSEAQEGEFTSFNFEGISYSNYVDIECSEDSNGYKTDEEKKLGFFTYRKNITPFFTNLQNKYDPDKISKKGKAVEGRYTVSGLECTDHEHYKCNTTMVSAWSIVLIYSSQEIGSSKKLYMYTGLSWAQDEVSEAKLTGFELPDKPVMRLTAMLAEGDVGLFNPQMEEEAIFLMGEGASLPYRLENKCNTNTGGVQGNYEVYNAVSSVVNWNPDAAEEDLVYCIEADSQKHMIGVDVDTFLLDAGKSVNLQEHLYRGNTSMDVRFSVNQDAILTNFLVISVDDKAPAFDIPPESQADMNWPHDREKHFCSCARDDEIDENIFCDDRPFYYLIKVENWGSDVAENVRVVDNLPNEVKYIPGTTEMGTVFNPEKGYFTDWVPIPDKAGDQFPLSGEGYVVAESMSPCNWSTGACSDTRLIRFKVKPDQPSKNTVFENTADIIDEKTGKSYKVNRSIDLELKNDNSLCKPLDDCSEPDPGSNQACGGFDLACETDDDCASYEACVDNECVSNPDEMCSQSKIIAAEGKNTPPKNNTIIIPKDNNEVPLTLGQFSIDYPSCDDKVFLFNSVVLNFDSSGISMPEDIFSEFELIWDKDGNGKRDGSDIVVSKEGSSISSQQIRFELKDDFKAMPADEKLYFIVRAAVDYKSDDIGTGTYFNFSIKNNVNFGFKDNKNSSIQDNDLVEIEGGRIEFAEYSFEPTGEYFIFTVGGFDPPVPPADTINSNEGHLVMHLRTKALNMSNQIESINVRLQGTNTNFGEHITKLELHLDSTGDGKPNDLIAELDKDDLKANPSSALFPNLSSTLAYSSDQEKYLLLKAYFKLSTESRASFMIRDLALSNPAVEIYENSVESKIFFCDGDKCGTGEDNGSKGCSCSFVATGGNYIQGVMFFLAAFFLIFSATVLLKRKQK